MNVRDEKPDFTPIAIVLETRGELDSVIQLLDVLIDTPPAFGVAPAVVKAQRLIELGGVRIGDSLHNLREVLRHRAKT
jgi:hypothetical protein